MDDPRAGRSQATTGVLLGVVAYGLWGLWPIFLKLFEGLSPVEIVANRVVWALVLLLAIMTVTRRWRGFRATLTWRPVMLLAVSAVLLSLNWGTYVYAVISNQMVEASLGYFINPLITVALAVIFLGERLHPVQWIAVAIAMLGVVTMAVTVRAVPWIGLALALTFGLYGLIKKFVDFGAVESLTIETAILFPVALIALLSLGAMNLDSPPVVVDDGWTLWLLLMLLGPVTAIPLLAFNAAANRIPLSLLGILQFISPTAVFILGVLVYDEPMSVGRWIGFILIWTALGIFTADAMLRSRRSAALGRPLRAERSEPELQPLEPT